MSFLNILHLYSPTALLAFVVTALLGFIVLRHLLSGRKNLPPGPIGFPIVGYLPFFTRTPHVKFQKLSATYGDVMSFQAFGKTIVVLGSHDAIRDAFITQANEFAGRPKLPFLDNFIARFGIIPSEGEPWKIHRRFALSTLRDFGFGKRSLEARVQQITEDLIKILRESEGKPIDSHELLANAAANVICSLLFDTNFKSTDLPFLKIRNSIKKLLNNVTPFQIFLNTPLIKILPVKHVPGVKSFVEATNEFIEVVTELIEEHKTTFDPSFLRDYVDVFLDEAKKSQSAEKANDAAFTEDRLKAVAANLFVAGTETTSNTMYWLFRILMLRPEIQKKLQAEIDDVIGKERFPSIMDRSNMPYTEATINEVLRLSSIVPLGLFHSNPSEVKFRNYVIPERSIIVANLWSAHFDPKYWPDPENFDPTRFLGADGKLEKRDSFFPFSAGKRFCLGETLARMELFLYITAILQRFNIHQPEDDSEKNLNVIPTFVRSIQPYKMCARVRS